MTKNGVLLVSEQGHKYNEYIRNRLKRLCKMMTLKEMGILDCDNDTLFY
jgi:hypothetical protein